MHTAYIIHRTTAYINNATGEVCEPAEQERLMDAIFSKQEPKYTFVELYRKAATIRAKSKRELAEQSWQISEAQHLGGDFEVYILQK